MKRFDNRRLLVLLLPFLLLAQGCKDKPGPTGPEARTVASVAITPANPSVADAATVQLTVTLTDQHGQPFTTPPAGVSVVWSSSDDAVASVSASGLVTGERPGQAEITAAAGQAGASTAATVTQVATGIEPLSGDAQTGSAGEALSEALTVRALDRHGDPVPGVTVTWAVTDGGGSFSEPTSATDDQGTARTTWTLGAAGENTAEARAGELEGSPAAFTAEAGSADQPPDFDYQHQNAMGMATLIHREGRWYHVYEERNLGEEEWVGHLRTSDDGVNWTNPVRIDATPGARQASTTLLGWGAGSATHIAVAYEDRRDDDTPQLRVAVSLDGGQTFGASVQVSSHTGSSLQSGLHPSIARDAGGTLYAAWVRVDSHCANSLWFSRSTDEGASWSTPQQIRSLTCLGYGVHAEAGEAGEVWLVGQTPRTFSFPWIYLHRSSDGGGSWAEEFLDSGTADHPSLLRSPDGTLHAIWQHRDPDLGYRVHTSRSTNGGADWSAPVQVSDDVVLGDNFSRRAHHVRSSMAVGPDGTLYAVWADEREDPAAYNFDVYLSRSSDGGATWSADERINDMPEAKNQSLASVSTGPGGALVIWVDDRSGMPRLRQRLVP